MSNNKLEMNRTEIICLLDRSGSMQGLEKDTIGGYNAFIQNQAALAGETKITTILFDDTYELIHNGVSAGEAVLQEKQYFVRGSTALYDAVGRTILDVNNRIMKSAESENPDTVIFVITTDGYENSSREYTAQMINYMITEQKQQHGWNFLFFGADIDAQTSGSELGISREDIYEFKASPRGVKNMMCVMESAVSDLMSD